MSTDKDTAKRKLTPAQLRVMAILAGSTPSAGRPIYSMSCGLALVSGRPCDLPGCAASADP
jgi:hypothetical protein